MYSKILVPLDGSHTAQRGLQEAIGLAKALKTPSQLRLLHVIDDFPILMEMSTVVSFEKSMQALRDYAGQMLDKAKAHAVAGDVEAEISLREVTKSRIAEAVIAEAIESGCELIVMGTHGRRGFSRLALGSDADMVVRASPIPVLLVRRALDPNE
jgi:nucleotide-binding universal stress UspA family protein